MILNVSVKWHAQKMANIDEAQKIQSPQPYAISNRVLKWQNLLKCNSGLVSKKIILTLCF